MKNLLFLIVLFICCEIEAKGPREIVDKQIYKVTGRILRCNNSPLNGKVALFISNSTSEINQFGDFILSGELNNPNDTFIIYENGVELYRNSISLKNNIIIPTIIFNNDTSTNFSAFGCINLPYLVIGSTSDSYTYRYYTLTSERIRFKSVVDYINVSSLIDLQEITIYYFNDFTIKM